MNLCFVNILIKSYTYVWYPGKGWRIGFVDLKLSVGGFNDSTVEPVIFTGTISSEFGVP